MTGSERSLVRRRGEDGKVTIVAEVTPYHRSSIGILVGGGEHPVHRIRGRLSLSQYNALLDCLERTGTIAFSVGFGEARGYVSATPLGRFDLLTDGAKSAMLCLMAHKRIRESPAAGSGQHPASLRSLKALAVKAHGGWWTLTQLGEQTAAAVIEAGLAPAVEG